MRSEKLRELNFAAIRIKRTIAELEDSLGVEQAFGITENLLKALEAIKALELIVGDGRMAGAGK